MKFVEWCDLFLIGHQIIDKQHQVLFDISNKFHDQVNKGFNKKRIIETLNELINYAEKHFDTEECIIEKFNLPRALIDNHKNIHENLITEVFQLNEDFASGKITSMYDIEKFLTKWLILHILIEDKKYKDYLLTT